MQAWSAPATRCWSTLRTIAPSSPHAMIASNSRSLTDERSSEEKPERSKLFG
jgi:hypothetical protein